MAEEVSQRRVNVPKDVGPEPYAQLVDLDSASLAQGGRAVAITPALIKLTIVSCGFSLLAGSALPKADRSARSPVESGRQNASQIRGPSERALLQPRRTPNRRLDKGRHRRLTLPPKRTAAKRRAPEPPKAQVSPASRTSFRSSAPSVDRTPPAAQRLPMAQRPQPEFF
jgi:hypothetical protein